MIEVMGERDIDMAFRRPQTIEAVASHGKPDLIVSMGCGDACPLFPDVPNEEWDLEDPAGKPISLMREVRDDIEKRVKDLCERINEI